MRNKAISTHGKQNHVSDSARCVAQRVSSADSEWTVNSWKEKLSPQDILYEDQGAVQTVTTHIRRLPPLVTSWEVERLKSLLADAERGKRFLLQGGDCAETFNDCRPDTITAKLKILLQMALVLVHASEQPVIKIGRIAGQYAKPRSSATETRRYKGREVSVPSYFGDLVNGIEFDSASRSFDPHRLILGYNHAALTLNFIRSLMAAGFADVRHPEYWDLDFLSNAALPTELRKEYQKMVTSLSEGLRFTEALCERDICEVHHAEFFTSHEGLNLFYESAQTRRVPRREGIYNLTTHLLWLGERTRQLFGPHVEYFRGIANPLGIKVGPSIEEEELTALIKVLNPANKVGKLVVITRFGADRVRDILPKIIDAIRRRNLSILWVCDPMHGNTTLTRDGIKTRHFDKVLAELEQTWDVHREVGSRLGGVHFELTGEDVAECIGGAAGVNESDLLRNYASACDPRLNYEQSMELAFQLAKRMRNSQDYRERGKI